MSASAPRNLKNKSVLITGGGSGVGFECAKIFGAAGAKVIISGRNAEKLNTACDELHNVGVEFADCVVGDISDSAFAPRAFNLAAHKTGAAPFLLVNNAGIILRQPASATSDAEWRELMGVNLDGAFYMSREAAKRMEDGGAIINVSSTCGQVGVAGLAAYCASKGGLDQMTRAMALELAPRKICVNAVAPGAINSPMLYSNRGDGDTSESIVEGNLQSIPVGAIAEPEEIARAIYFLSVERHITGTILSIDGGYTAR